MDNNQQRTSSSSSEDSCSCSEDLSKSQKTISPNRQRAKNFLQCLSKRLGGRRFQHDLIYNSQDDLRSSSTDSFSLTLKRTSKKHIRSSSIDIYSEGESSRTSSSSSSPASNLSSCDNDNDGDDETSSYHDYDSSSYRHSEECKRLKGINLNLISLSTVSRVLQNLSSSSNRSLSCNSTPIKQASKSNSNHQKNQTTTTSTKKSSSQTKQPQRILRQPVNYVYLKGISGLPTRRVPRSSLCCNYAYR